MPKSPSKANPSQPADNEPAQPSGLNESKPAKILECPAELCPAAREEWDRIVGDGITKGVLSTFDRGVLAIFCTSLSLTFEAAQMVQKHGTMVKSPNGFPQQSPYLSHYNKQVEIVLRAGAELGFSPAARSRIFSFDHKNALVIETFDPNDPRGSTQGYAKDC
jgi:P27 family predicted phage terminase small subunit